MAYGINGTLKILQDPYGYSGSSYNRARNWVGSYSPIHTVNAPIVENDVNGAPVNMANKQVAKTVGLMTKDYSALMKAIDKKKGR